MLVHALRHVGGGLMMELNMNRMTKSDSRNNGMINTVGNDTKKRYTTQIQG